jgi:hypothetical protein
MTLARGFAILAAGPRRRQASEAREGLAVGGSPGPPRAVSRGSLDHRQRRRADQRAEQAESEQHHDRSHGLSVAGRRGALASPPNSSGTTRGIDKLPRNREREYAAARALWRAGEPAVFPALRRRPRREAAALAETAARR